MLLKTQWQTAVSWVVGTVWNNQTAKSPNLVCIGLRGVVEVEESYPTIEVTGYNDRSKMVKDND